MEILLAAIVALLVILYVWYTIIITRRNSVKEALSGIDVQLKKRSSLIPNVLAIAKKFMAHETELLNAVTKLRTKADSDYDKLDSEQVKEHLQASSALSEQMGKLMISVEAYPDLKSDQTMLRAQKTYSEVEALISAARRFYNSSVTQLNNSVEIFPGSIIAGMANVRAMPFYEADEASKVPVNAGDFLI